ncbi:MAG: hypothetical protein EXR51_01990 [Dehalococcoidia bacterium]|nr:hypothetical protein [Dehalococcoidia bacterium]
MPGTEDAMTNAAFVSLQSTKLTLRMLGGLIEAELPAGTPVINIVARGAPTDIKVGAWISAVLRPDGVGHHNYTEDK